MIEKNIILILLNIIMKVVGIDLAGKTENPTGFCLFTNEGSQTKLLFTDTEILKEVEETKPD